MGTVGFGLFIGIFLGEDKALGGVIAPLIILEIDSRFFLPTFFGGLLGLFGLVGLLGLFGLLLATPPSTNRLFERLFGLFGLFGLFRLFGLLGLLRDNETLRLGFSDTRLFSCFRSIPRFELEPGHHTHITKETH